MQRVGVTVMGRRGLLSLRAVIVVAVVLLIVYGFYTYNELQTELEKRDNREERVKRQLDTVSSELESKQLLYIILGHMSISGHHRDN